MLKDEPVWAIAAFDLPSQTREQRRDANRYRHHLLELGFSRVQLSVYAKYMINGAGFRWVGSAAGAVVPPGGVLRVIPVSDHEWARALCYVGERLVPPEDPPQQLAIFP